MTFDLKFSGQEVFNAWRESIDLVDPGETDSADALAVALNCILKKKLERAPEVFGNNTRKENQTWVFDKREKDILKARLVCVEEVGK